MTTSLEATVLQRFDRWVHDQGDAECLHYFGRSIDWNEADRLSRGIAARWMEWGIQPGDRIGLLMQNIPQYVLSMLAAWRLRAAIVPMNPMFRAKDIAQILNDSQATLLVAERGLHADQGVQAVREVPSVRAVFVTDPAEMAAVWPDELARPEAPDLPDVHDLLASGVGGMDVVFDEALPEDIAALTYTSGTTGPPKGAMNTHANVADATRIYLESMHMTPQDICICMAPLFHVSGLVGHMGISFTAGMSQVLAYRFEPGLIARTIEECRTTYTIASITAFTALMGDDRARSRDMSSMCITYSGGAPVAPATVERFRDLTGAYIHNIYGLTEATGPVLVVPRGMSAPVDAESGVLAAGLACPGTDVRVIDDAGADVAPGEPGELLCRGAQVVPGYWNKPAETAATIRDGWLHTGDVAIRDAEGWCYIVDRIKDQINASGFKVWPGEVEALLMEHPSVHEAAVVGVPDAYRGETVKAFVVCRPGMQATPEEIIAFAKERLAAYKYPRIVEVVDDLPKTASGKILRRELRQQA